MSENIPGILPKVITDKESIFTNYHTRENGLTTVEVQKRLEEYGANRLPEEKLSPVWKIFLLQFASPLIYVLVFAAIVSLSVNERTDFYFILWVLLFNATLGTIQEYSAGRSAKSLKAMVEPRAIVIRDGHTLEVSATDIVPGDIITMQTGSKIPADALLIDSDNLHVDESMLTGESLPVNKNWQSQIPEQPVLSERINEVFAGTIVVRGSGKAVVSATGLRTELGHIANRLVQKSEAKAPLIIRMEAFSCKLSIIIGSLIIGIALLLLLKGTSWRETLLFASGLAVAAIPEGLPIAITVALAVGMNRMAKRNVIVKNLMAVEALGSCTVIASDKTGTLTMNELSIIKLSGLLTPEGAAKNYNLTEGGGTSKTGTSVAQSSAIASDYIQQVEYGIHNNENTIGNSQTKIVGNGFTDNMDGVMSKDHILSSTKETAKMTNFQCTLAEIQELQSRNSKIIFTAATANEAEMHKDSFIGDPVDVAFLKMVEAQGIHFNELRTLFPQQDLLRYSSESRCSASVYNINGTNTVFIKGAPELILELCSLNASQADILKEELDKLYLEGLRVIALASGKVSGKMTEGHYTLQNFQHLEFLGFAGMMDPLRQEAKAAVACCRQAGVRVAMITGDSPSTAYTIAEQLGLEANEQHAVVTGIDIREAKREGKSKLDAITANASVYARIEPEQKLDIVQSMMRNHQFVAVTGDGVNDAPAIKNANVGIAMGKNGTDVAKESASIVLTDDNFASIVSGISEGRITYSNIRKVIFLLISACFNSIGIILVSLLLGLPNPFSALQMLWINLVTEGCNSMPLSFGHGEGDEMQKPPRQTSESVFDHLMIRRITIAAVFVTTVSIVFYALMLKVWHYDIITARSMLITLIVVFEVMEVFNSCSEYRSAFQTNFKQNPWILLGISLALLLHVAALNVPFLANALHLTSLNWQQWLITILTGSLSLAVMELEKWQRRSHR